MRTLDDSQLERLARRRAAARMGWYLHAGIYLLVTAGLALLSTLSVRPWAVYPAVGWGLGVAVHGLVVFLFTDGSGLFERLVRQERERLAPLRDPW
ncbi:MAG TPA: 2TM domain-containing protein [Ramlibacter sp.]|nr:2TM domain-containing protein [Ramlibacter sp.]